MRSVFAAGVLAVAVLSSSPALAAGHGACLWEHLPAEVQTATAADVAKTEADHPARGLMQVMLALSLLPAKTIDPALKACGVEQAKPGEWGMMLAGYAGQGEMKRRLETGFGAPAGGLDRAWEAADKDLLARVSRPTPEQQRAFVDKLLADAGVAEPTDPARLVATGYLAGRLIEAEGERPH